jgi:hypothetical protein
MRQARAHMKTRDAHEQHRLGETSDQRDGHFGPSDLRRLFPSGRGLPLTYPLRGTKGRQLAHSLKVRALGRARGAHASTSVAPLTYG